ncbi:hypothetical protein [Methanobacterium aggregans]|uniref:hypothetical protein n=1 Tax=Methanobacterium aggregans TaxID=1615586 RepID=UPI001AE63DB1|nr:hypothetical protein [Methanobacterium aggregans]MBP2044872.1 hypothetical protein [Methanobacterium aggregans]
MENYDILTHNIKIALENIDKKYIKVCQRIYGQEYSNRLYFQEKQFAYEFYHQYRMFYSENSFKALILQTEVNKRYENSRNSQKIPYFILHIPDSSDNDIGIIEFKCAYTGGHPNTKEIKGDLDRLIESKRTSGLRYKKAFEVIIGTGNEINSQKQLINSMDSGEKVRVMWFNTDSWKVEVDEVLWDKP